MKIKVSFSVFAIKAACLFSIIISLMSCSKKLSPQELAEQNALQERLYLQTVEKAKNQAVADYAASLSDEVRISQLFLVNVEGNQKYSAVEKSLSGFPLVPGGALLFSYNISTDPLQTYEYIKSIRDFYLENKNLPPYIAVDQEGGVVNRLRGLTSTLWAQKKVAESFTPEKAEELYSAQARQMKNLGFHLNLAPVVEVENDSNKDFLESRTFGNLEKTLLYGRIAAESYEKNGIAVVLKHFPGNSGLDPHMGLPKILFSQSEWDSYFKPFKFLLSKSSAVLMSHAVMKPDSGQNLEKYDMPACFSKYWVSECLRGDFAFSGLVFSDDIFMAALAKNGFPPEIAAVRAIEAGVDVIMLSEKRFGHVAEILLKKSKEDEAFAAELERAVRNVLRYKIKAGILILEENSSAADEMTVPSFSVKINPDYCEFDLKKFDQDYKLGMEAYN